MIHEETIKRIQELVPESIGEDLYRCNRVWEAWQMNTMSEDDFEIISQPITLAVVVMAIKTLICKRCRGTGGTLGAGLGYSECGDCGGDKYDLPEDFAGTEFELGDILHFWELSKDNFNDQSEETKSFIGGLLGN